MFRDDPDPTVTTARVESGIAFGRAREEVRCTVQRGVGMGLGGVVVYAEGLRLREEKRERSGSSFRRPKTSDVRPAILPL